MSLFRYLLLVSLVVAVISTRRRIGLRTLGYFLIALAGAVAGALVAFGDDPLLMRYPLVNERTMPVFGSVVFVAAARVIERKARRVKAH